MGPRDLDMAGPVLLFVVPRLLVFPNGIVPVIINIQTAAEP